MESDHPAVKIFRRAAMGQKVKINGEASPYGPGLYDGDVNFILAEHRRRRGDGLKAAMVGDGDGPSIATVATPVNTETPKQAGWRAGLIQRILALAGKKEKQ